MAWFPRRKVLPRPDNTTAVVLAGGASSRFGAPKALAALRAEPLVRWVARLAATSSRETLLSIADDADAEAWLHAIGPAPTTAKAASLRHVVDHERHAGPVAGLRSALREVGTRFTLVLAVDMPLVPPPMVLGLMERLAGHDAVCFHLEGYWRPMPALWRTVSLAEALQVAQEDGLNSMQEVLDRVDARPLGPEYLHLFDPDGSTLRSINTRADLEWAERWLADRSGHPKD